MHSIRIAALSFLAVFLLTGCPSGSDSPESQTKAFWETVKANDFDKAKELVTEKSKAQIDEAKSKQAANEKGLDYTNFKTETAKVEGDKATVKTMMSIKIDENSAEAFDISFDSILAKENNAWKIDAEQTLTSMGKAVMEIMMKGLGDAMKELGQGLSNSMEELGNAMQGNANGEENPSSEETAEPTAEPAEEVAPTPAPE